MPLLVTVGFVHYSPKDSEEGIKELIIANNIDEAINYIDAKYLGDELADLKDAESPQPPEGYEGLRKKDEDENEDCEDENEDCEDEDEDEDCEDEDETISVTTDWLAQHPEKIDAARALGLKIDTEYGDIEGPELTLTLWWEGNDWREANDTYYGVTHYEWRTKQEITEEFAAQLVEHKLAKRV
jgi:hypothetical protein